MPGLDISKVVDGFLGKEALVVIQFLKININVVAIKIPHYQLDRVMIDRVGE